MEIKDVLGIGPIADAAKTSIDKTFNGLGAFLEAVFLPGLQEFGYLMKDKVRVWRLNNALKVMDKARGRLSIETENWNFQIVANARVGLSIMESCSMVDDEELQDLWAGLFASSCTEDGRDDSNLKYVDLLKRMSLVEARILKYACETSKKIIFPNGLIVGRTLKISFDELVTVTGIHDTLRLDSELDHMSSLSLFQDNAFDAGGFVATDETLEANISPSALALNLYYKCTAINISEKDFWKDSLEEYHKDK